MHVPRAATRPKPGRRNISGVIKAKVSVPVTGPVVAQRVGRGIALLFTTAALEGGEWSAARPGRTLPLGKTRYQLYRELAGLQGRSGRVEDIALPGFDLRTVQPVASHCTDYATLPTSFSVGTLFYLTNLITTLL